MPSSVIRLKPMSDAVGGSGIDQYSTDWVPINGSPDKSMRWKLVTDYGHSTVCYGVTWG
jgi:hypothetical protein